MEFQFTHPGRGATTYQKFRTLRHHLFQFTHPGRGATREQSTRHYAIGVSIHAPREGCDRTTANTRGVDVEFQFTHPGRGATTYQKFRTLRHHLFQFTHPGRGATTD